jgi:hypothetical protein
MPQLVCNGAMLACSFGAAPSTLTITPEKRVNVSNMPAATIMDYVPMKNIATFGMCLTLSNPAVSAATSAASGVFTPAPCVPVTTSPWTPGAPRVLISGQPALHNACQCMCMWGGVITITSAGQFQTNVGM